MASPVAPQNFSLDRSIFNETLYSHIRDVWFAGTPAGSKRFNDITLKRWWGKDRTEEERDAFDNRCRDFYGPALESIGPDKLALPPFKSFADQLEHASEISAPLLADVKEANSKDAKQGADTLLSLILLLDQMPRNLYRTPSTLPLVYTHYDRLAWSLVRSARLLTPNPTEHNDHRGATIFKSWYQMPLVHAEDQESQDLSQEYLHKCRREAEEDGDDGLIEDTKPALSAGDKHKEIIDRFGRFPHRNEGLGRESTSEEKEWLKTGETFGVKQQSEGKSEL